MKPIHHYATETTTLTHCPAAAATSRLSLFPVAQSVFSSEFLNGKVAQQWIIV
jgi:hypothetical protein